ncbi:MFS transporter [Streptacidiphilus rugosus]|uniref:MFS transporter n=1 Tax=Streptacidiphilus rugosus TaxID=405783 RepID=UPI00068F4D62|nr:MFS transporter [Streptacidiphilus rugosus]
MSGRGNPPAGVRDAVPGLADPTVRPRRVLTAASLATGMCVIDISILNVAIPAIRNGLRASLPTMQLAVDAYVIVMAGLVLAGAATVARFGALRVFRIGVALFGLASVLCGLAPDAAALVAARALQGLGGVLLTPATLVLLTDTYRDADGRARAVSVWATVAGSPVAFGPILGGALVAAVGWRSVFLVNVPAVAAVLWLSARHMPRGGPASGRREPQDVLGQLLAVVFLGGVALALTEGRELGWTRPLPAAAAAAAVLALGGFLLRQRRFAFPAIPGDLFRAPGFRGFVTVGLLLFAGYYGLVFSLSVYLQQVHGYGPVTTGLCFLPSALPITLMPLVAGRVHARLGAPRVLGIGVLLTLVGGVLLALVGGDVPVGTCVGLLFIGLGFGLATVPQITLVMATAPPHRSAIASGLMSAGRSTGTTLGVALLGGLPTAHGGITAPALAAVLLYLLMTATLTLATRRLPPPPSADPAA